MSITTEINSQGTHLTIKVKGRFDYNLQEQFRQSYQINSKEKKAKERDCQILISNYKVDLTDVNYLDSSALGMLLSLRKFSNHQDCVEIIGAKKPIKELLELSGFDKLFIISN